MCPSRTARRVTFQGVTAERSRIMRAVRSRGNKTTEQRLRFALVRAGIGKWVLHPREITGCPDFYFSKAKLAVFVDGCFWHGCADCGHIPRTRSGFWRAKINGNRARDAKRTLELADQGIRVLRFWEHDLSNNLGDCLNAIMALLAARK